MNTEDAGLFVESDGPAGTGIGVMAGKVPMFVVSRMTTVDADKSAEEPAAMLVKAACPAVGVVNFVMVKVTRVFAA